MAKKPILILGADHAGFRLKEAVKRALVRNGWTVNDLTPDLVPGDDYPLVAKEAAAIVARDRSVCAILACGTGLGMDIAANRTTGVRAVVVRDVREAKLSREHNHANILVLGGWTTPAAEAKRIVDAWLKAKPSKAGRHVRRIKELDRP